MTTTSVIGETRTLGEVSPLHQGPVLYWIVVILFEGRYFPFV